MVVTAPERTIGDSKEFICESLNSEFNRILESKTISIENEESNLEALETIITNFDVLYDRGILRNMKVAENGYEEITKEATRTIYKSYLLQKRKSSKINYCYARNNTAGRRFPAKGSYSLQGISREVRHTIAEKYYVDIDVKNCHPTILVSLCRRNNWPCGWIVHYMENRDKCLNELCNLCVFSKDPEKNRDIAKSTVLAMINGGSRNKLVSFLSRGKISDWFYGIETEMKEVFAKYKLTEEGKIHYNRARKQKGRDGYNLDGSMLNYKLCEEENKILSAMLAYCNLKGVSYGALCHDGFMPRKEDFYPELLEELKQAILILTGYDLTLTVKEFDRIIDLSGYKNFTIEGLPPGDPFGQENLATYCLYRNRGLLLYDKRNRKLYCFDVKTKLWIQKEFFTLGASTLKNTVSYLISSLEYLYTAEELKEKEAELQNYKFSDNVAKAMQRIIMDSWDHSDIVANMNRTVGILPLPNGSILDLNTLTKRERTKEDYFTFELPYDYQEGSLQYEEYFKHYIGELLLTEDITYIDNFLIHLGSTLIGRQFRVLVLLTGSGKNGKSTLIDLIKQILGQFYCTASKALIQQGAASSLNMEYQGLEQARFVSGSELEESKNFDVSKLKALTGNDSIRGRTNITVNTEFKPTFTLWISSNEVPTFNDSAFKARLRQFRFKNVFEPNVAKETELKSRLSDFFSLLCRYAHSFIVGGCNLVCHRESEIALEETTRNSNSFEFWMDNSGITRGEGEVKSTELYAMYNDFLLQNFRTDRVGPKKFNECLRSKGFVIEKSGGVFKVKGIKISE